MVVQVRWIKGLFHLMLLLRAAAAETTQLVREGDKAMLTCGNLKENPAKCGGTTWTFTAAGTRTNQELVTLGRVKEIRQLRISLSEDCSLLIPEVRAEDAGLYACQQFRSGVEQQPDAPVYLTVVTLTAQVKADYVELTCCVFTYKTCSHKVTWFFNEVQMKKGTGLVLTSQNSCSATANVMTCHEYWKRNTLLTCQVQYDQVVKTFPLRAPDVASAETTTTVSTRTADDSAPLRDFWWFFIIIAAIFVVFLVVVVIVVKKKQTKAVEKNCNDGRNTHSAVTHSSPEISQDKRDAEDPVSYATIIFRSPPRAQGQRKNSDGGKVIYTTLKSVPSDPSI
eukprot:XP_011610185.1 PREDICTED: uncharacterized protein LOC105417536 isoform X1 [Takifugu rubripes]